MNKNKKTGSAYHWLIVVCCCCMATAAPGLLNNIAGVFYGPMSETLGVGLGSLSMYQTIQNIFCGFGCPLTVKLSRRIPHRKMMLVGFIVSVACYVGMANVTAVWQLYILGALNGLAASTYFLSWGTTVLSNWFYKRAGLVTGIAASFSGISGAVMNPIFNAIIERFGWRTGYLAMAAAVAVVLTLPMIFLRLHPADKGLGRYGEEGETLPDPTAAPVQESTAITAAEKPALYLLCCAVCATALVSGLGSHMASYAASVSLTSAVGALLISGAMIGNCSSKLVMGVVCDAIGARRAAFVAVPCIMAGCLSLVFFSGAGAAVLLPSTVLVGVTYSFGTVLTAALAKHLFGANRFGTVYSYTMLFGNVAGALGVSMVGFSYDLFHSFTPVLLLCTALALSALALVLGAYRIQRKNGKV